jgi:hypothetical protein
VSHVIAAVPEKKPSIWSVIVTPARYAVTSHKSGAARVNAGPVATKELRSLMRGSTLPARTDARPLGLGA